MRRALTATLAAALAVAPAAALGEAAALGPDPLEPATSGGVVAVDRALAKLAVHARLLVVGAHPDDEDNALLTWVGHGLGGEAAYLSLSRGEGGQNLIGAELGTALGVVRTGELLAARRLEGSRQYFASAYDFGYTRSLEETFERWPRAVMVEDAVRVVRRFRPQVIVAIFPESAAAGHGQHRASAVVARQAYETAGEGLPGLSEAEGLAPWSPSALYRRAWSRDDAGPLVSLAAIEPFSGRTLGQIAAAARSLHRSQDMGRLQGAGPADAGLVWLAGGAGEGGGDPFSGIDTRLAAIADLLPPGEARAAVAAELDSVAARAAAARAALAPRDPGGAAPALAAIVGSLRRAADLLPPGGPGARTARALIEEKRRVAEAGLAAAAGLIADAWADRETVAPGGELELTASLWWPAGGAVRPLAAVASSGDGWLPRAIQPDGSETVAASGSATPASEWQRRFRVEVPASAAPTVPYFLDRPRRGDLYDWSGAPPEVRGEPFQPPPLLVRFEVEVAGARIELEREAVHRWADEAFGERRRPLRAVPEVELSLEPELVLWTGGDRPAELAVTVAANGDRPLAGRLGLFVPDGWAQPGERRLELRGAGDSRTVRIGLRPPPGDGRDSVIAELVTPGGAATLAVPVLAHPHVRPVAVPRPAVVEVSRFELALPRLRRLAYVPGASDRLPPILAELGLPVERLDGTALERADLSAFDVVVVGPRAYEIDPALGRANPRLLDWVRGGGLLVVQYQQYAFVAGGYAPYPLEIDRPHGRVTDEAAPVRVLASDHPALAGPNPIGPDDWQGWVQERGLYFAGSWDERYEPLVELADPGGEPQRGALLVAPVGRGTYVYTGLAFFRQLPAGVPGAVRLFVNLLGLGRERRG